MADYLIAKTVNVWVSTVSFKMTRKASSSWQLAEDMRHENETL